MTPIDTAIQYLKGQLASMPSPADRQAAMLRYATERVHLGFAALIATSPLGAPAGWVMSPRPSNLGELLNHYGPALHVACLCDELFEAIFNEKPFTATVIPPDVFKKSLAFRLVHRHLGASEHAMVFSFPDLSTGNRLFALGVRAKKARPVPVNPAFKPFIVSMEERTDEAFTNRETTEFSEIFTALAPEICAASPEGRDVPPSRSRHNEPLLIDAASFTVPTMSLHQMALITRGWGEPQILPNGCIALPGAMTDDILDELNEGPSLDAELPLGLDATIRANCGGRVLMGRVQILRPGAISLDLFEDKTRHPRLTRILTECREIEGSGRNILKACRCMLEDVWEREIVAARLGLQVYDDSFLRAYSRAESIVTNRPTKQRKKAA